MTLALLMFIYGMYRYWIRIYSRFALSSDRMITGKFEFGGGSSAAAAPPPPAADQVGLNDLLSGGIASLPASASQNVNKRTHEAEKIIGLVEPRPTTANAGEVSGAVGPSSSAGSGRQVGSSSDKCLLQ